MANLCDGLELPAQTIFQSDNDYPFAPLFDFFDDMPKVTVHCGQANHIDHTAGGVGVLDERVYVISDLHVGSVLAVLVDHITAFRTREREFALPVFAVRHGAD